MESFLNWFIDNKLSLRLGNLGKTECVLFCASLKLKKIINFNVKCKEQINELQDGVRYLDKYMNYERIVNSIIVKVNSRWKYLYRNCKNLNSSTRLTLSKALI